MRRRFRLDGKNRRKRDIEREIALHLELRTQEFEQSGMTPEQAREAALEAFGDRMEIQSEVQVIDDRAAHRRRFFEWRGELLQDLRFGLRVLLRSPAFALVAILTLGIGIGANTAIFSVLRSVLLRPLPYTNPEQLVQVWSDHRALGRAEPEWLTPVDYIDLRDGNRTFASMAAYQGWGPDITDNGEPESLTGLLVSGNYFDMLGTRPTLGRLFTMSDDDASAPPVVVLSHAIWTRRFGADSSVIGRSITLNGAPWTVIGVLPSDFRAPTQATTPTIFRTIRRPADSQCGRGCITVLAIGRLKPGVTIATAEADLDVISDRLAKEYPETNNKVGSWLVPLHEQLTGSSKPAIFTLSVAVALVLLIGCVNLANLLLVRAAARSREIGVRAALGAGRGRLTRQLLTEAALLAAIGGIVGVFIGTVGSRVLATLVPEEVRRVQDISMDGTVLLFALGITVLSAVIFGVFPALQAVRTAISQSVRGGREGHGRGAVRTRSALVVTQLALAVMLLVGSGLLLRSFMMMQQVDLGYRAGGVAFAGVNFRPAQYPSIAAASTALDNLLVTLRANPAIKSAEATDLPVLSVGDQDISAIPVGEPDNSNLPPSLWIRSVTPGYFSAMHMRLVSGRQFTPFDRFDSTGQLGIINEFAAERYFPGKDPVGRVLARGNPNAPKITIVGVVANARHDGPNQPFKPELFVPLTQRPVRGVSIVMEPTRDAVGAGNAFGAVLREVNPSIPLQRVIPIEELLGASVALPRLYASLVAIFASAALLLAALGVYGVMAYSVSQRQREIGVRIALGAEPRGIQRMILRQGGTLAAAGLVIGVGASLALGQLLSAVLFGVTQFDVPTLATVPALLGIVTILASWVPARRAMRMDPASVIRED